MSALDQLPIRTIITQLPRRDCIIGTRSATDSITLHWNGPAVAPERQHGAGLLDQLTIDARWQMRPGWGGTVNGAPHLMYHFTVDAIGAIWQTANLDEILWHCAHTVGNSRGLAIHFPMGSGQDLTLVQWASGVQLVDALRRDYGTSRARVFGHLEWKHATACPGPRIMQRLYAYRLGADVVLPAPTVIPGIRRFQVVCSDRANVRQGPGTAFATAGQLKSGAIIFSDGVKKGEAISGNIGWAHMARVPNEQADLGFISMTLLEEVR